MRKTVLIIEDEPFMREIISDYFMQEDFEVLEADNGIKAIEIFEGNTVDLVLLDIMLPGLDGLTVCRKLRKASDVPIIIITARSEEDDKLLGYELGADDYITKPFSPKVLVAKSKMVLKRADGTVGKDDDIMSFDGLEINKRSRTAKVDGENIELAPKEYELLLYLAENKGKVLSRENILNKIWGYDYFGDMRTVDTHIKKLRAKLGNRSSYICTMIRSGYKFEV